MTDLVLDKIYTKDWFAMLASSKFSYRSELISKFIVDNFAPKSAIDVGCANGFLVKGLLERGVDSYGIDGSSNCIDSLVSPYDRFILHDLRKPYKDNRKYDFCSCLEVAEHIEPEYTDIIIATICGLSDILMFSSCRPRRNKHEQHVNLHEPDYWQNLITSKGFELLGSTRERWYEYMHPYRRRKMMRNYMGAMFFRKREE